MRLSELMNEIPPTLAGERSHKSFEERRGVDPEAAAEEFANGYLAYVDRLNELTGKPEPKWGSRMPDQAKAGDEQSPSPRQPGNRDS